MKLELTLWRSIKKYIDKEMYNKRILLKCKTHDVYEGYYDVDNKGWYRATDPDHLKEIVTPHPTHFRISGPGV